MGSFSDYLENKVLEHIVGKTSYTMPSAWVALLTATPNDASTGSTVTEPSGNAYARVAAPGTAWGSASGGSITNSGAEITFPQATGSWGTVTSFVICDASTGGNVLAWGTLTSSKTIDPGDTAKFTFSALTITLD